MADDATVTSMSDPSMSEMLLDPLIRMQGLAHTLFLSLSPPSTRPPPTPATALFLECDAALAAAVQQARVHQCKQRRIDALRVEVLALDARLVTLWDALEQGRRDLEDILAEGAARLDAVARAKNAAVPYPELLAYAQSLSAFTSAPPHMRDGAPPGHAPPPLFFPPFPNEEKMRRGRLNAEAPLGHIGEIHAVGQPPAASPPQELVPQLVQPAQAAREPYRQTARSQPLPAVDFGLDLNDDDDL